MQKHTVIAYSYSNKFIKFGSFVFPLERSDTIGTYLLREIGASLGRTTSQASLLFRIPIRYWYSNYNRDSYSLYFRREMKEVTVVMENERESTAESR